MVKVDFNAEPKLKETAWSLDMEEPVRAKWKQNKAYAFHKKKGAKVYSIDTPPPYVNSPVHIGHASTYTIMDMIARFKRMVGHDVIFPLGLDRNGLPIEVATEKKFNVSMLQPDMTREKFIDLCKQLLEQFSLESVDTFYKLGHSFSSWERDGELGSVYYTDEDAYRAVTQATFIDLWKRGLVYEDDRVNNYCPKCQTTIADAEVDYKQEESFFNHVKWTVKETGEEIIIGTTRPELMAACAMVVYNPEDTRYKHLAGKHAVLPLYGKEVPIKAHPYAKIEKGTGLVMMCSFGDVTDIRFFREEKLEPKILIERNGKLNAHAGFLQGLSIKQAREKILEELKAKNLLAKQEKILHDAPICERSKTPIEFIKMPELYVKQLEYKDALLKIAHETNIYDPKSRQILLDWINAVSMDWAVSRRRYYATEIPLWYCAKCNETVVPEPGPYYQPWKQKAPVATCTRCGSTEFRGEDRVFDTWFDSSISCLYILGYLKDPEFFKAHFPCSLRPQGKEIVRTWLYYTLLRVHQLTHKPAFNDIWIHHHILDEKGRKMSKSLGNTIDPQEIIKKLGAESFRFWCAMEGNLHQADFMTSEERIKAAGKFLTKLYNVARFISMFPAYDSKKGMKLTDLDKLMLAETNKLIEQTKKQYEIYDFHNPVVSIRSFIWDAFASHYLELVKTRAYNQDGNYSEEEQNAAFYTLNTILETMLKLLAPVIPMITAKIYESLYGDDIHTQEFPHHVKVSYDGDLTLEDVASINSEIWKFKKDNTLSLKDELSSVMLPAKFAAIEQDLKAMHKIREVAYGTAVSLQK